MASPEKGQHDILRLLMCCNVKYVIGDSEVFLIKMYNLILFIRKQSNPDCCNLQEYQSDKRYFKKR